MSKISKKILREIISTSNAIRKKYQSIKHDQIESDELLNKTFKPITTPLETLVKNQNLIKKEIDDEDPNNTHSNKLQSSHVRKTEYEEIKKNFDDIASKYWLYNDKKELDHIFGVRIDSDGGYMIGNSPVEFHNDHIVINGNKYKGTSGLYELIFKKRPNNIYSKEDEKNYLQIILNCNAHREGHTSLGHLKSSRLIKFRNLIKPYLLQDSSINSVNSNDSSQTDSLHYKRKNKKKIGKSLPSYKSVSNLKKEYIYWDNVNEIVDRLELLIAEKEAGNTGVDNEILSIVEELREANIIE